MVDRFGIWRIVIVNFEKILVLWVCKYKTEYTIEFFGELEQADGVVHTKSASI